MKYRLMLIGLVLMVSMALLSCSDSNIIDPKENLKDTETLEIQSKQMSMVSKMTATWCSSCGSWGWDLFEHIINTTNRKAVFLAAYCSATSGFYNATAQEMYSAFSPGYGLPSFLLDGKNETVYLSGYVDDLQTRDNIINRINENYKKEASAGTGIAYSLNGQEVKSKAAVQFFKATEGEYYLSVYVIEDGARGFQSTRGDASHHYVLRGSLNDNTFGEKVASGRIDEGFKVEKEFTMVLDDNINPSNLHLTAIIWKKTEAGYEFINAAVK